MATIKQIKEELVALGVEIPKDAKKAELELLLEAAIINVEKENVQAELETTLDTIAEELKNIYTVTKDFFDLDEGVVRKTGDKIELTEARAAEIKAKVADLIK